MPPGEPYLDAVLESLSIEAPAYVTARPALERGAIDLSAGEVRVDVVASGLKLAVQDFEACDFRYQDPRGLTALRETYLQAVSSLRGGLSLSANDVLVTAGAKHALWLAFMKLVKPGALVLLPSPGWPPYRVWARALGAHIATYDAASPGVTSQVLQCLNRGVVLVLNSPNNPTGTEITPDEVRLIVDRAAEVEATIISDEVYREYARHPSTLLNYVGRGDVEVAVADSVSKSAAAAGLRVGFLVGSRALSHDALTLRSVVDSCPPSLTQRAATSLLSASAASFRAYLRQRAATAIGSLQSLLEQAGLTVASSGGIYIWMRATDGDHRVQLGNTTLVGCRGENFGAPGYVRLCPITHDPAFHRLVQSQGAA